MVIFSIILLIVTPLFLVMALAVRFAGGRPVLNSIDYSTVTDLSALHRWAGNRLLLLPVISGVFGFLSIKRPALVFIGGGAFLLAVMAIFIWILAGSDKFRRVR